MATTDSAGNSLEPLDGLDRLDRKELATIRGTAALRRVEVHRIYPVAITDVWQALIEPQAIARWFGSATVDPREGGQIVLTFGKTVVTCSIKTFMPPHVLAYTWEQEGESTSLVQFDLIETAAAETRVTVVQTALDAIAASDVAAGWTSMLERLSEFLRTGEFAPEDKTRWQQLYEIYQKACQDESD